LSAEETCEDCSGESAVPASWSADDTCDDCSGESPDSALERAEEAEAWRSLVESGGEVAALLTEEATLSAADEADVSTEAALADTDDELDESFEELLPQPARSSRETAAVEAAARWRDRMGVPFVESVEDRAYRARESIHLRLAP
jgi:hypothetical protein